MDITNTIHDIIMGQVDARLEPARLVSKKRSSELAEKENQLCSKLNGKMRELCEKAEKDFRVWLDKLPDGKSIKTRKRWTEDCGAFSFNSADRFDLPFDSRAPEEAFSAYRRDVLQKALRVASENPSKTAYAEVDKFLAGIDPVKEIEKRIK